MADIAPNFGNVKTLKDLAKIFAFPVLTVSYILQSGMQIGWEGKVWFDLEGELSEAVQFNRFVLIVVMKSLWATLCGGLAYMALAFLHLYVWDMLLPIVSMVLFTFGFLGLFQVGEYADINSVNAFWFYACFVWGFFLLNIAEQFKTELNK